MPSGKATLGEIEAFWESLEGPLAAAMRATVEIVTRRVQSQGQVMADLSEIEVVDLVARAFREAVPAHYPHADREEIEIYIEAMFEELRMDVAATVPATCTTN